MAGNEVKWKRSIAAATNWTGPSTHFNGLSNGSWKHVATIANSTGLNRFVTIAFSCAAASNPPEGGEVDLYLIPRYYAEGNPIEPYTDLNLPIEYLAATFSRRPGAGQQQMVAERVRIDPVDYYVFINNRLGVAMGTQSAPLNRLYYLTFNEEIQPSA